MEVKIKAKSNLIKDIKLAVPYDGIIEVDEFGCANVSEACAQVLVNGTHDWQYADVEGKGVDDVEDDINTLLAKIKSAPLEELINIANEAGFDEAEWKKFAKNTKAAQKLMSGYLIKKFNEVASEDVKDDANGSEDDANQTETENKEKVGEGEEKASEGKESSEK